MGQTFTSSDTTAGVMAINNNTTPQAGPGVHGQSAAAGVWGDSTTWHGVVGTSQTGFGVYGKGGSGVVGESDGWMGVYGKSGSTTGGAGVMGEATGPGVVGKSQTWHGVYGETQSTTGGAAVMGEHKAGGIGVLGTSANGTGVWATSTTKEGVHAETKSGSAAVAAYNLNASGDGFAIYGKKEGPQGFAGFFEGNVWASGNLSVGKDVILTGADCAEDFDVCQDREVEPGTVMALGNDGILLPCQHPYDKRVAGVVSGAGQFQPAIVLDRQKDRSGRKPLALVGKVCCKVDASHAPVEVGDLLTTSTTTGHAMKAADPLMAFGSIIGKALQPLAAGQGMIAVLVSLR